MKIKWFGQSAFLITSEAGTRIITDPYTPSDRIPYRPIDETADVVTVSHGHGDHSNAEAIKGNPVVLKEGGEVKGVKFAAIPAFHDNAGGAQRGNMTVFCFEVDGIRVCHLGDLGHALDDRQAATIGKVDILLIPVGGNFTIGAVEANQIYKKLGARIVVPMHFKNSRCPDFPVAGVEDFISGKPNVTKLEVSEAEFRADVLPIDPQIVVLTPAN
jgi:L-ascorbate metabolism protein UlaG (beta-lactamase superfamily)